MYLLADQAGRTLHAAGRTGLPEATAEGETSEQGHLQKVLEDVLVLRDVTRFYLG